MIRKSVLTSGSCILGLVLAAACTSTVTNNANAAEETDPRRGEKVNKICFSRSIDSFSNTSRKSVVLETSPSKQYLVETGSCFQLDRAQRIAIDGATSCLTRGDRLIVSEDFFSGSTGQAPDRCLIKAIYIWNKDAEAAEDIPE